VPCDGRFEAEFRASQLELVTPVCLTVGDACRELSAARAQLVERLDGRLRIVAVGTHPVSTKPSMTTSRERFQSIARDCVWATRRGQPSGLHVHIGMSDPAEALAVYNAARSYLPELAALAANSPFFEARDSGLASSRLKLTEDLQRSGIPPAFANWRKLAEFAAWGSRGGLFRDLSYLWWDLRPRPDYGTLEIRIADVQTRPEDAAAVAAFCQALVAALASGFRRSERLAVHESYAINENRWRAVRDGLDAELVDLATGEPRPARDRLSELLEALELSAAEVGCSTELAQCWNLLEANGAVRQRRIARRDGLAELLLQLAAESERADAQPATEPDTMPQPRSVQAAAEAAG
jgi:carboxylate-amine ligase